MCSVDNKTYTLSDKNPLEDFLGICEDLKLGREPRTQHIILDFPVGGIFYRGEPEIFTESALIPKIFRKEHLNVEEAELISEFKVTYPEHVKTLSSDIDLLSFMQHQNVPTRLLDWSTNPLVALYFAIGQDQCDLEEEGVVYIVPIYNRFQFDGSYESPIRLTAHYYSTTYSKYAQAGVLHEIESLKKQSIPTKYLEQGAQLDIQDGVIKGVYIDSRGKKINLTDKLYRDAVEVFPPNSHARIRAQSGVFTIQYGKYLNRQKILCDEIEPRQSYLVKDSFKIRIPNKIKPYLKTKLEVLGITEFKLFPKVDKFYSHFRKKKIQPIITASRWAKKNQSVTDSKKIREILLKIDNDSLSPGITNVSIPHIIEQFKLLGIAFVINEIFKNFFCYFVQEPCLFTIFHLYKALEEFCIENKVNQKLVLQQLAKLEQETELLSVIVKRLNIYVFPMNVAGFDLKDNLFHKALKLLEKKPTTSPHDSVEVNQETTLEKS